MKWISTVPMSLILLAALPAAGADGPGAPKAGEAGKPKTPAAAPMSRDEAIQALEAVGFQVKRIAPTRGMSVWAYCGPKGKKALALLPMVADTEVLNLCGLSLDDADSRPANAQGVKGVDARQPEYHRQGPQTPRRDEEIGTVGHFWDLR